MQRESIRILLLFLLILLEVVSSTVWTQYIKMDTCRWVHFLSGIGISILLFLPAKKNVSDLSLYTRYVALSLFLILIIWLIPKLQLLFISNTLDYTKADMLPVIKIMAERWIHWDKVYSLIPNIWNGVMPIYLPAFYLPFVPSILFSFDMRWITILFILIPFAFILYKSSIHFYSVLVFLFIGIWFDHSIYARQETIALSQEGVVYGYYMMLCYFMYTKNIMGIAIAAIGCMLSRYSGVFFILAYFISSLTNDTKTDAKRLWMVALGIGGVVFTIGQGWDYLMNLVRLPYTYVKNIEANTAKYQDVLNDGLGLMPIIGIEYHRLVFFIQIILLLLIAIAMIILLKKYYHRFYFIAFLKLSLVIFYNFLILPYTYLMYTSVFVSFVIYLMYTQYILSLETLSDEEK